MNSSDITSVLPSPESISSEDLIRSVDALLFLRVDYWLDGGVFRLAAVLNALGIRTNHSCEGSNPLHRNTYGRGNDFPISMPHISIASDNRHRPTDRILGESRLRIPPDAALAALFREFCDENSTASMMQGTNVTPLTSLDSGRTLTLEDHQKAIDEFNAFARWLIARYFQKGSSVEEAVALHAGRESSLYSLDDIPDGIIFPGSIDCAVTEYQNKGLPVTVAGIISRTKEFVIKLGLS